MFAATKHNSCFFPVDFSESSSTTTTNISFIKLQKVVCCKQKRYTDHLKKFMVSQFSTSLAKKNPESPTSLPFFVFNNRCFVFQKTPQKKKHVSTEAAKSRNFPETSVNRIPGKFAYLRSPTSIEAGVNCVRDQWRLVPEKSVCACVCLLLQ